MSLPVSAPGLSQRCHALALKVAHALADRQQPDGQFALPDFYAKAFAINLWTRISPTTFNINIDRALDALRSVEQDKTFHTEFIEYALRDTPDIDEAAITEVLRGTSQRRPDVVNWQILGLINRQSRTNSLPARLINAAHSMFICQRYWRAPAFLDRPKCFSAQYHAFCAALLAVSTDEKHQRISRTATALIAKLACTHGCPNLLGRGAGQSFGAATALYALTQHGFVETAEVVLSRLEAAHESAGELPLNLLAPNALPDTPGPLNPETPGWYSYNRHDDYLAFAGYWLLKTAHLKPTKIVSPPMRCDGNLVFDFVSPYYHAQMALCGIQGFDISAAPVVMSGQGMDSQILLPPTGGEEDQPSLYGPASIPLPAIKEQIFARILQSKCIAQDTVEISFELNGVKGTRTIQFEDRDITIRDQWQGPDSTADLFRILIDGRAMLEQASETTALCRSHDIRLQSDRPLELHRSSAFSAAGPATRLTAPGSHCSTLKLSWGCGDA